MSKSIRYLLIVPIIIFCNFKFTFGQSVDSLVVDPNHLTFADMINLNRELSYLTYTQGFSNVDPLLFEAKIAPSFYFSGKKSKWALELNTAILVRMLNKKSFPIRTPSYMPSIKLHRKIENWESSLGDKLLFKNAFATISLTHHSNGQEGAFRNDSTGVINEKDGNFSTNYLNFSLTSFDLIKTKNNKVFRSIKLDFEYHPTWPIKWYAKELDDQFGFARLFFTYNIYNLTSLNSANEANKKAFFQRSRISLKSGWIFGSLHGVGATSIKDRLIFKATYMYRPEWIEQMAFFVRYYHGQDYYNIHFENTVNLIQIGIISDPLEFMDIRRVFR